ncbi:uncharacterized protein LOC135153027 isoform X1 [Daucus carota subsp. sativus]|uniref:uncharacterized protein LOC135153027 isoform X1 n=1 Tax=Daucus carota subsp. sativus TaxID=79200 RepID=UPI0030829784
MGWYSNYCVPCDQDLQLVEKRFKCMKCGKFKPYPDRKYEFCMLCADHTGTVPILFTDDELTRFIGKTVYDILADETQVGDGDKFPPILLQFEKRTYNFTLHVTKENVVGGSNVYTAVKVSADEEISANDDPPETNSVLIKQTEISNSRTTLNNTSPATGESTNKSRARKKIDVVPCDLPEKSPEPKLKNVKTKIA